LAAALQFPGRDARVSTTLLGVASRDELDAALAALQEKIPPALWDAVADAGIGR